MSVGWPHQPCAIWVHCMRGLISTKWTQAGSTLRAQGRFGSTWISNLCIVCASTHLLMEGPTDRDMLGIYGLETFQSDGTNDGNQSHP